MINPLLHHLGTLTPAQREDFAAACGTTSETLRLAAHGYKTNGQVSVGADMARRIEHASGGTVRREEICAACSACDLAKTARTCKKG